MSIRIKIAEWLAPGLFRSNEALRLSAQQSSSLSKMFSDQSVKLEEKLIGVERLAGSFEAAAVRYEIALKNIQALRTPSCAHIGKRMADIADAALSTPSTSKAE